MNLFTRLVSFVILVISGFVLATTFRRPLLIPSLVDILGVWFGVGFLIGQYFFFTLVFEQNAWTFLLCALLAAGAGWFGAHMPLVPAENAFRNAVVASSCLPGLIFGFKWFRQS